MSTRRVRKRDGREVPFDKAKIEDGVRRAQAASGEEDPAFATEVADVVEFALLKGLGMHSPASLRAEGPAAAADIEHVQDLVEKALIELGHASVAKAYILYRDKRARIRSALTVHSDNAQQQQRVSVREADGVGSWSKGRIVAALMQEADLPREVAGKVAAAVEERVFASGFKRISTSLIRELVDNELVQLGLEGALRQQGPVGVARHDLERWLREPPRAVDPSAPGPPRTTARVERSISGALLRRFVLEDVLDETLVERHLSGELHLEGLEHPHLPLVRSVPADLLRDADSNCDDAWLEGLAALLPEVGSGVVVEDFLSLFARARARGAAPVTSHLAALVALSRATGRRIDLIPGGGERMSARQRSLLGQWMECLDDRTTRTGSVRFVLDAAELSTLLEESPALAPAVDRLLTSGALLSTWSFPGERFAGPGMRRSDGERGALALRAACALNLVRLAREAGPWREESMLEGLVALVERAGDALLGLDRFQRQLRAERGETMRARGSFSISPVGLREALRWLGDGEVRADQGARLLTVLVETSIRVGRERGLSIVLSPFFGERARSRFARLDAERFRANQGLLFPGSNESALGHELAYSSGYDLAARERVRPTLTAGARALGELCAGLRSGALSPPLSGLSTRAAAFKGEGQSALAAWRRFEQGRTHRELNLSGETESATLPSQLHFDSSLSGAEN